MAKYIPTDTFLDDILAHKVNEVAARQAHTPLSTVQHLVKRVSPPQDFAAALRQDTVALIAEVKKASPSKGVLIEDFDPVRLGKLYAENGAAAISVLTDEKFFQGHLSYLEALDDEVEIPLLRKDFIIDPYQIYESRMARADAVLLIVAALSDMQLRDLHSLATDLGMGVLVEVHNVDELERALAAGAAVIGVNNRDLKTFEVDTETVVRIATNVPDDIILVAESGLKTADDVQRMGRYGAHAVLVGEGLVVAEDIPATVRIFGSQKRV